jgi:dolichol-phosphate mannosyltransferase
MRELDIIIPIYNEGERILNFLNKLEKNINNTNIRFLICYDAENDTTLPFIKNSTKINSKILLIKNPSRGPCTAVIEGIKNSSSDIILTIPADENLEENLINKMIDLINQGYDLVVPSRFVKDGKMIGAPKLKKLLALVGSFLISKIALIPVKDATNCFKMFKKSAIKSIELESNLGFLYAFEITIKFYLKGYQIIELPYTWIMDSKKKSNFKTLAWLPSYINFLFFSIISNIKKNLNKY